MDEKHNTLLARGADNDVVRLRWRIKIRENVVARLQAENKRLIDAIRRLAEQGATLSVQGGNVTVTLDATLADEETRRHLEEICEMLRERAGLLDD